MKKQDDTLDIRDRLEFMDSTVPALNRFSS